MPTPKEIAVGMDNPGRGQASESLAVAAVRAEREEIAIGLERYVEAYKYYRKHGVPEPEDQLNTILLGIFGVLTQNSVPIEFED